MRVAAIIPAYNEEKTIGSVVSVVKRWQADEVIVVDDGSSDRTGEIAKSAGARVITLPQNVGKGGAMKAGAESTEAEVVLFVDADLTGLTLEHLTSLATPVLNGDADMTVGVFEDGRLSTDIAQKIAPFLSGQRAMLRRIVLEVPGLESSRYGVELAISRHAEKASLRVQKVELRHLAQVTKEEKRGFVKGFQARMRMYWEIIRSTRGT